MNLSNAALGKIVAIATAATITAVVVAGCISVTVRNKDRVVMGVQANGTTIAGLTKNEARKFFADTAEKKLQRKAAVLTYKERNFQIDPADINLHGNVDKAVETAYNIGRDGSPIENLITQMRCAIFGATVTMHGFGASAPAGLLFEKFGFTKEHVADVMKEVLKK